MHWQRHEQPATVRFSLPPRHDYIPGPVLMRVSGLLRGFGGRFNNDVAGLESPGKPVGGFLRSLA
jgi:hypothetical protein